MTQLASVRNPIVEEPIDYIPHASFDDPAIEPEILAPMPGAEEFEARRRAMRVPKGALPELAPLYTMPLLTKAQEQHLFRQMNYLKYKAAQLMSPWSEEPESMPLAVGREIDELRQWANQVRELLINANMRLVVNFVKRHHEAGHNFFELLSDGNLSLLRAVEKFDWSRGFKFCTYATRAILTHFARTIPGELHRRERFVTGHEEVLEGAADNRTVESDVLAFLARATHRVNQLLSYLEPREREIIRMRAGLDDRPRAMTLEEIGKQFGITKERVRQLNAQAMKKLRIIAEEQQLSMEL